MFNKIFNNHRSIKKQNKRRSTLFIICKGTRFFDSRNPSLSFFSRHIGFLINQIDYSLQNHRLQRQTHYCSVQKIYIFRLISLINRDLYIMYTYLSI